MLFRSLETTDKLDHRLVVLLQPLRSVQVVRKCEEFDVHALRRRWRKLDGHVHSDPKLFSGDTHHFRVCGHHVHDYLRDPSDEILVT